MLVIILLSSCTRHPIIDKQYLAGNYRSITKNDLKSRLLYKGRGIGTALLLRADSTFYYKTCATVSWGKWYVKQDSLILKAQDLSWRIKELNTEEKYIRKKKESLMKKHFYIIKNDRLFLYLDKDKRIVSELEKTD